MPDEVRISELWSRKARVTWRAARGVIVSHYTLQYKALAVDMTNVGLSVPIPTLMNTWDTPEVVNVTLTNSDLLHVA